MIEETRIKSHLIITDIHEEYSINWCGKIKDVKPQLKNGMPVFIIIGSQGRMELNTIDINQLEHNAKLLTYPKGRAATTCDTSRIYIKGYNGEEILMGILTHKHIKSYAPMFDKVGHY